MRLRIEDQAERRDAVDGGLPSPLPPDDPGLLDDLHAHGYCLIAGGIGDRRLEALCAELDAVAADERASGTAYVYEGGSNQRVWNLLNKGRLFEELVQDDLTCAMMRLLLGEEFLLSSVTANIAGPGGAPMVLHADQSFVPPPWPPYPLVANVMWMLDDFTAENGATCVVPGSHLLGRGPGREDMEAPVVPVTGPAGTLMVFDGRLWHQTGRNTTRDVRRRGILTYYCRPFMRQQENASLSLHPAVLERATPLLRRLVGRDVYQTLGMVDGLPPQDA